MRRLTPSRLAGCVLLALLLLTPQLTHAVPIGPDVSGFQLSTNHDYSAGDDGWVIGAEGAPLEFTLNDNAGPWLSQLQGSPVGNLGLDFTIREYVRIAGEGWDSWEQEFLTEGWNFISGTASVAGGGPVLANGTIIAAQANAMKFFFDLQPAGTVLEIVKVIRWVGTTSQTIWPGVPAEIQILSQPTGHDEPPVVPEPATLGLIGIGLSLAGLMKRQQRRRGNLLALGA